MQPPNEPHGRERGVREFTRLICEGATFGYNLFTQPSEWTFDWSCSGDRQAHEVVLFPALFKTTDDHGHFLPKPELKAPIILADGPGA